MTREEAIKILNTIPTISEQVDALEMAIEAVKGKRAIWMPIQRGDKGYSAGDFICSCCGKPNKCYSITDYCCNCGAEMRGGEQ